LWPRFHPAFDISACNEIIMALDNSDTLILALSEIDINRVPELRCGRRLFGREPDFGVTSVTYAKPGLFESGEVTR
jgi:hypothetical protein